MKRRGVLGFLGGAAVAGPAMAQQALTGGLEALSAGGAFDMSKGAAVAYGMATNQAMIGGPQSEFDPVSWAKRDLAEFLGRSSDDLARERLDTGVDRLDPDLAGMQSIALQAKIRMQRDRNFERNRAQQRNWIERRLQDAIKQMASLAA